MKLDDRQYRLALAEARDQLLWAQVEFGLLRREEEGGAGGVERRAWSVERGDMAEGRSDGQRKGNKGIGYKDEGIEYGNSTSSSEVKNSKDFLDEIRDKLERGELSEEAYLKAKLDYETEEVLAGKKREELMAHKSGLTQASLAVQKAELNLSYTEIRAPFSAFIADLDMGVGQQVSAGQACFKLVDLSQIEVDLQVLESEIGLVKDGRKAEVTFPAYPGERFHGRVVSINPMVDSESKTTKVMVRLENFNERILPGMFAYAKLEAQIFNDQGAIDFQIDRIQLEQALQSYSQALRLKPDHFLSLLASGAVLRSLGRYEVGEAILTGAIAVNPRVPSAFSERGTCRLNQNKLDLAQADFAKVAEINPQQYTAYLRQSMLLARKGDLAQALAMIDKAVEVNSYSHYSRLLRGKLYARLSDDEKAIANFTYVIEYLKPRFKTTQLQDVRNYLIAGYFQRALAQARLGRIMDARKDVSSALKVEPDSAAVQNLTAWFLATCPNPNLRDAAQSVRQAKKAVQQAPQQEVYWRTLGVAHYRDGNWKAAVTALEKSMSLGFRGDSNRFFLAMAHCQLGQKDEARKLYEKAVEWMQKNRPWDEELIRFRAEAAELLGIPVPVVAPKPEKGEENDSHTGKYRRSGCA